MKSAAAIIVACLGLAGTGDGFAQTGDHTDSTLTIHMVGSAMEARTVNRSFLTDSRLQWHAEGPTRLLMRLEVDTTRRDDTEGFLAATVSATVWRIGPTGERTPLWSVREPGNSGEIDHDQPLFIVRQAGCCGARDSLTAFSLYGGRRLFTATSNGADSGWATLDVPNSGGLVRLAAFHAAYSATDDAAFGGHKGTVGLLSYASPDAPLARYRLVAPSAASVADFMGAAELHLVDALKNEETSRLTLWSADGKKDPAAIGGFAIRIRLSEGNTLMIPVSADKLDVARAVMPAGLEIEPVPLP
jgi:hypothetical protein